MALEPLKIILCKTFYAYEKVLQLQTFTLSQHIHRFRPPAFLEMVASIWGHVLFGNPLHAPFYRETFIYCSSSHNFVLLKKQEFYYIYIYICVYGLRYVLQMIGIAMSYINKWKNKYKKRSILKYFLRKYRDVFLA